MRVKRRRRGRPLLEAHHVRPIAGALHPGLDLPARRRVGRGARRPAARAVRAQRHAPGTGLAGPARQPGQDQPAAAAGAAGLAPAPRGAGPLQDAARRAVQAGRGAA